MDEPSRSRRLGTPTPKMLGYARKIAGKLNVELSLEAETTFDGCKAFIDAHKEEANRPSERQLVYARRIAAEKQIEIPVAIISDSRGLSQWIDEHK